MSTTIEVNDIGPVSEFEYKLDKPGVYVLCGKHGIGKTTILRLIELLIGGRADRPQKSDGAKAGTAAVGDRSIRITKRTTYDGTLSVEGLGDLDIAKLHSPKFNEVAVRDRHRIAALVRLAGVTADINLFHERAGGVSLEGIASDDLVDMAERVKRTVEAAATAVEVQRNDRLADCKSRATACSGVDLNAPHDKYALEAKWLAARDEAARLRQQKETGEASLGRAAAARKSLDNAPKADSVESATAAAEKCAAANEESDERVGKLEAQMRAAREAQSATQSALRHAETQLQGAKQREELAAGWRADIEVAEAVECPTDADITKADAASTAANAASELGARVRLAKAASDEAVGFREQAAEHEKRSIALRKAAGSIFGVLSEAIARIPDCPLLCRNDDDGNPRLVCKTDRSDYEPFDELSSTEKWRPLLDIAGAPNRLIVFPQEAFSEMNESTRLWLHEQAAKRGCYIFTAVADEGELRCEPYADQAAIRAEEANS